MTCDNAIRASRFIALSRGAILAAAFLSPGTRAQGFDGGAGWLLDAQPTWEANLRAGSKPAWMDFGPVGTDGNSFAPQGEQSARRLIAAVGTGDLESVRRALAATGAPAARTLDGETAIAAAVRQGHVEIARFLLSQGADPNGLDAVGQTPLMLAVRKDDRWLVRLLLRNGADPDLADAVGQTPLVTAIRFARSATARELLAAGADPDLPVAPLRTGMRRLFPAKGISGLLWAINEGQAEIVEAIVKRGARLNAEDEVGRTPLYWAVHYNDETIARTLLKAGAQLGRLAIELPEALR